MVGQYDTNNQLTWLSTHLATLLSPSQEAKKAFGHIDVLVNNAGLSMRDLAVHTDPSVDEKVWIGSIDINN